MAGVQGREGERLAHARALEHIGNAGQAGWEGFSVRGRGAFDEREAPHASHLPGGDWRSPGDEALGLFLFYLSSLLKLARN